MDNTVIVGNKMTLEKFMDVVRFKKNITFSHDYINRVNKSRELIEKAINEKQVIYGVTTGFGSLSTKTINESEMAKLQHNILLSHAVSVGEPYTQEEARATMFMVLQNLGQGYSGVRLVVLELIKSMLNLNIIPFMPREGSVGYLSPEAHMALVLIGKGKAYVNGQLLDGDKALLQANLKPITLAAKEGLALISGTTSVTALGAIALYDLINASKSADVIASITFEVSKGVVRAFDKRVMDIRPHEDQSKTAHNIRSILRDSEVIKHYTGTRLQDALSLRCIPQLHGAAKKTLLDAKKTIEIEMNSCCDNPIVWDTDGYADVYSACNCDSSYVGLSMDSCAIAATMIAKMSERRNNRLIDENLSGYPAFLIKNPGLNSGLMIPQYSQAGLLNDMRILSTPASIDNTPTCSNQEDYVAMGYNAAKKAITISKKLEYILAIELLSGYQAQKFLDNSLKRSLVTSSILDQISKHVPQIENDIFLYPHIEYLKQLIHNGHLVKITEDLLGETL